MDTASRVINYISTNNEKGEFPIPCIIKGIVFGQSKKNSLAQHVLQKNSKFCKLEVFQPSYQVKDKQSDKTLITSELYKTVGIKKIEGGTTKYYQLKKSDCAEKYGYRLPFVWELEEWEELKQKYVPSEISEEEYVYILDEEKTS
ncbi:MAG: hypothetical protein ACR5KV_00885 [Wolbachia sp.]